MRRTIGISFAVMVISAGAMAEMPDQSGSTRSGQLHNVRARQAATRNLATGVISCQSAQARSDVSVAYRRGEPMPDRGSSAAVADGAGEGPPDAYIGPVHATGRSQTGTAVWYNQVGGQTASGEILDTITPTAAHRSLPLASYAKVTRLDSGRSIVVRINDRGPWSHRFIIDLSPRAADELDVKRRGVAAVIVEPVAAGPAPREEQPIAAAQAPVAQ
jgi:hypothetical protein